LRLARHFHISPNLILEASIPEVQILTDVYTKNKQEQAELYFSIADYIVAKTSSYENESARNTAWEWANDVRRKYTGESTQNPNLGQELTADQALQFLELRDQTGISFAEYVNQYITQ
jgi:hypothetical protein